MFAKSLYVEVRQNDIWCIVWNTISQPDPRFSANLLLPTKFSNVSIRLSRDLHRASHSYEGVITNAGSDMLSPRLYRPNGGTCDPDSHILSMLPPLPAREKGFPSSGKIGRRLDMPSGCTRFLKFHQDPRILSQKHNADYSILNLIRVLANGHGEGCFRAGFVGGVHSNKMVHFSKGWKILFEFQELRNANKTRYIFDVVTVDTKSLFRNFFRFERHYKYYYFIITWFRFWILNVHQ